MNRGLQEKQLNPTRKTILALFVIFSLLLVDAKAAFANDSQAEGQDWDDSATVSVPPASSAVQLDDELADDDFIGAVSRLSLYQKIILLELNLIGHANADGSHAKRLARLEEEVVDIPLRERDPSVPEQIVILLQIAPPSDELIRYLVEDPPVDLASLANEKRLPFVASIYQQLNWIERAVYGKQFRGTKVKRRILKLELDVLNKSTENRNDLSISERVHNLMETVKPSEALLAEEFATPRTNPAPIQVYQQQSGPGVITTGLRKFTTGTTSARRSIGSMLTSPMFWTIVAGGAALFGAYMLSRSDNNQNYFVTERACMGHWNCHRCQNCLSCGHCKTTLQPCGVFLRTRGIGP